MKVVFSGPVRASLSVASLALLLGLTAPLSAAVDVDPATRGGVLPFDKDGKPVNTDFETGDLRDWTATGEAFKDQPIEGDSVHARRSDMKSGHVGLYWVGTYEVGADAPQGTLKSKPFVLSKPFVSFLIGGGAQGNTRVEIVRNDTDTVISKYVGTNHEEMKPVAVDLTAHMGHEIYLRLVDDASGSWGHINFDDFRLHDAKPDVPERDAPPPLDVYTNSGLEPVEAAAAMTVPEGFKVSLFAGEPDVVQPIAQAIDDRGRLWVAEAYSYPVRVPERRARDQILIFEDTDGDGRFDTRKVFKDKLNLVSGLEIGHGGVWVGSAPELLFIPDADGDDVPDGEPQVLLDGWGYQDTHETLNTFNWGPDGWLYGCHGVFTHSNVGKPGAPDEERVRINAGVWRYHPTKHVFEVFAEGTSNPWGVDFNDQGQCFITACVIPHLYHMIQGGRYQRQAGNHFNPFTYDDIQTIALHRHWVGATPHGGNNRSDSAGGGHAHAGAMMYLGGAWPERYRNELFMNNIHGARLNVDKLMQRGSGYAGDREPDFLMANDSWSQIINLQYGPDGQMYMIDWYDKNQCHHNNVEGHDRTNGRIFKVTYGEPKHETVDIKALDDKALVEMQLHKNDWYVRHARRVIAERGLKDPAARESLVEMAFTHADPTRRLRGLWALQAAGALDEGTIARGLANDDPYVRSWTIQFACEERNPSAETLATMQKLAAEDASQVVRLYLTSAAIRLPLDKRWDLMKSLLAHSEDADDHNLPLMYWYAIEPLADADPARALSLALDGRVPLEYAYMVRRVASADTPEALSLIVAQVAARDSEAAHVALVNGLRDALRGKRKVDMPKEWPAAFARLQKSSNRATVTAATALAVTFGDTSAFDSMRAMLVDKSASPDDRQNALVALLKSRDKELAPTLQSLIADPALCGPALRALAQYDDAGTPAVVLEAYPRLDLTEKRDALATLASRVEYARVLMTAVENKQVPVGDLSADLVRDLHNLKDEELQKKLSDLWGAVRDTPEERAQDIARYKKIISARRPRPDVELGRAMFAKTCQQCHTLFGTGGKVGPELTGSNRANLDYLLSNVIDPSALVGKEYQTTNIQTTDDRILTGIVRGEDKNSVTLVTATETLVIPREEIEGDLIPNPKSMMPDDLWKPLSDHEVRSLVKYLASPAQVPMKATAENAPSFFNGRDLTGWQGDPDLWSVEDGELVGRSKGLKHNNFILSDMMAEDFRLSFDVKLVDNRGNSGVQFRSEPIENGEMRGYQADIGAGWWGKLYEENRRGLLWDKSGEPHVKKGEWNHYEILASGNRIRTWINGEPCVVYDDENGASRGIFALQLHSGGPTEVRFKNFKLELDPKLEPGPAGQ